MIAPDRPAHYPEVRKVCDMDGVRGGEPGLPVSLCRDEDGRLFVRGLNEGGFACVDIDLKELLAWTEENLRRYDEDRI